MIMRALFVVPPWSFKDTHMAELQENVAGLTAPTGILYLAACAREAGHEVKAIDGALCALPQMLREINSYNPDFLGISVVTMLWHHAKLLITEAKKQNPNLFIAVGGPHPTALMEKSLQECSELDAIVYGEGEQTIVELLNALEKRKSLADVRGIIFRDGGKIIRTQMRPLLQDLDSLPYPAFDLIDLHNYRPSIGHYRRLPSGELVMSRGCPMNCIFCSKITGRTIRTRNPVKVADELEFYIQKYGIKEVKFWTELFTYDKKNVIETCNEFRKRKFDITWSATARVDSIDKEMLLAMKRAGCWYLQFGIESGVQKNLNTLRKGTTPERVEKALKLTHSLGLKSFCTFILGIPGETYEEALQTIEFACKLNPFYAEFFPLTPLPGTDLYDNIDKYGKLIGDIDRLTMHHVSFVPYSMTKEQIEFLRTYAFKRFYSRPRYILSRIASLRSPQDIYISFKGLQALLEMIRSKPSEAAEQVSEAKRDLLTDREIEQA